MPYSYNPIKTINIVVIPKDYSPEGFGQLVSKVEIEITRSAGIAVNHKFSQFPLTRRENSRVCVCNPHRNCVFLTDKGLHRHRENDGVEITQIFALGGKGVTNFSQLVCSPVDGVEKHSVHIARMNVLGLLRPVVRVNALHTQSGLHFTDELVNRLVTLRLEVLVGNLNVPRPYIVVLVERNERCRTCDPRNGLMWNDVGAVVLM